MTIKELYDEFKAIHCEDYNICINNSDIGMFNYDVVEEEKNINFDLANLFD